MIIIIQDRRKNINCVVVVEEISVETNEMRQKAKEMVNVASSLIRLFYFPPCFCIVLLYVKC